MWVNLWNSDGEQQLLQGLTFQQVTELKDYPELQPVIELFEQVVQAEGPSNVTLDAEAPPILEMTFESLTPTSAALYCRRAEYTETLTLFLCGIDRDAEDEP